MKKKILFLMPSMGIGGAEKVLVNFLNLLDYNKYEVVLYVARKEGELLKDVNSKVEIRHIFPNYILDKLCTLPYVKFGFSILFRIFSKRIIGKYDVAISFLDSLYSDMLFYSHADIGKKVVVIQSSYATYTNWIKNKTGLHFQRLKNRYSKMDIIIAVSNEAMDEFKQLFGEFNDMRVIYNPLNNAELLKLANEPVSVVLNKDEVNIVALGRLNPVKGYDRLIKASKILKDKGLNFHITIIGTGPAKADLLALRSELGVNDKVTITGFVDNPYTIINQADIYTMTSHSEGLPTALCEAVMLNKAVVVTNVSGCREVVNKGEFGIMVEETPEAIAAGLEELITNTEKRQFYSRKSKERSIIFDDAFVVGKYYDLFDATNSKGVN